MLKTLATTDSRFRVRLLFAVLYFSLSFLTIAVNFPYRPVPTDELVSYSHVLHGFGWLRSTSEILMNSPLHILSLQPGRLLVTIAGLPELQTFLVTTALCLNGIGILLGFTIYTATRRIFFGAGAAILFLVSAWPQEYLHFYTYAPIAGLYMMASLYCFTRFFLAEPDNPWLVRASGLCAGLFFLSGSSAKLTAVILVAAFALLIMRSPRHRETSHCFFLISSTLLPVVIFLPFYLGPLVNHLSTNITAGNGIDCLKKYGFLPSIPFLSFFHLLKVYSPLLLLLLFVSLLVAILQQRKLRSQGERGWLTLALLGIIVVHTLVLDLLPFTKLGRAQFPLMPIAIVAISSLFANLPSKRVGIWTLTVFMLLAIPLEIASSTQTWNARRVAPAQLERFPGNTKFVVLETDPHHEFLISWLGYDMQIVRSSDIPDLVQSSRSPVVLIVGPTGPNSGKSILRHSIMDDYYFSLPRNLGILPIKTQKLPYYAHYPHFMMEEENSQCFFFRHQVPDTNSPDSMLTVYFWPKKTL